MFPRPKREDSSCQPEGGRTGKPKYKKRFDAHACHRVGRRVSRKSSNKKREKKDEKIEDRASGKGSGGKKERLKEIKIST